MKIPSAPRPAPRGGVGTRVLCSLVLLWLVAYFLEDVLAERRGAEPLFSSTVERVEAPWVRLVFLSLPLQIVLVMVATVLARVPRLGAQRAGFLLASLALALAMGHAAISLATR